MVKHDLIIDGLKISYWQSGRGPTFLLLHGWGGSAQSLKPLGQQLVAHNFQVYLLNLPGFGDSSAPQKAWSTTDYTQFLTAFCQKLNLKQFFLLAHSFGGRLSVQFSVKHPEKVKALILCAPSGLKKKKSAKIILFWVLAKIGRLFFSMPPFCSLKAASQKILYFLANEHDYYQASGIMKDTFKIINRQSLIHFLPKVKNKTLLIWGKKDHYVPLADGFVFRRLISHSQLKIVSGRHDLVKSHPQLVTQLILDFLNREKLV